jgi:hypothetical protein
MTGSFTWIDWLILLIPLAALIWIGWKTRRYVHGVADFLSGGRLAGRYLICMANGEAAFGLISVVGMFEQWYRSGFAIGFWGTITAPIGLILALTGFAIYRYRETRAMTIGQFYQLRYSQGVRHVAVLEGLRLTLQRIGAAVPIVNWEWSQTRFPITGAELSFINILLCVSTYVIVSLLTCRRPYNLDRMLHRGTYAREDTTTTEADTRLPLWRKLTGITPEYSLGDKCIAWSVVAWSVKTIIVFVAVAVLNIFVKRGATRRSTCTGRITRSGSPSPSAPSRRSGLPGAAHGICCGSFAI